MRSVQERPLGAPGHAPVTAAYGLAHFGKSQMWSASEILFAWFLTEVGGLAARDMGLVLAAGYLCGAIADVVGGVRLAGMITSARLAAKLQLAGAALSALALVLLFVATHIPEAARLTWTLLTGLVFRIGYMLIDLPQNALLSVATPDARARSRVAALRLFFSGAAGLCVSASLAPLLSAGLGLEKGVRYLIFGAALSAVTLASSFALWRSVRAATPAAPAPPVAPPPLLTALGMMPRGVWVFCAMIFVISASTSFSRVEPYYAAYVLKSPAWGSAILMAFSLGAMASQPLWAILAQRTSRAMALSVSVLSFIASAAALWTFAFHPPAATACALVFGAATAGFGTTLWAAFADIVVADCRGQEGLAFGLLTASAKLALAAALLAGGHVLGNLDYAHADSGVLVVLMCLPPVIGGVIALAAVRWWAASSQLRS